MGFVEPLMLAGVAAASVPVVIHLLGRRRAPRRRFAALSFVLRNDRRLARGLRLKQWLLLALRVLLVAAMAVMMAKPVSERESTLPALAGGAQSAVVIIDDTLSMSWRAEGERLFGHARRRALELVRLLGPQAEIAVLSLSRPEGPLPRLSRDLRAVRAAIGDLRPTARDAIFAEALAHARGILAGGSTPLRRVFLFSDFAAHNGALGEPPGGVAAAQIFPVDVAEGRSLENLAIVALSASPSSAPGRHATRVTARVCNFAPKRADALVELVVDGKRAARGYVKLEPGGCGVKHFNHNFARGGAHETVVALEPDALPEDDRRYLRVDLQRGIRVLLVNGDPSPIRHRDELFYVDTALAAGAREQVVTSSVTADELGRVRFDANDVVLLCNVREVPAGRVADLTTFVERGGGLLISLGDQVREEAFNRALGKLLPQKLRGAGGGAARGAAGALLRIGRADPQHPIITAIGGPGEGLGLRSARFARVFRLWPTAEAGRRVVLSFDDGSPALVEARRGAGHVLLFASTLDRDWTDLPIRPGFVPLVQQSVRHLARALQPMAGASVAAGAKRLIRVPSWAERVRLIGPGGEERVWSGDALAGRRAVEVVAEQPGFYTVSAVTAEGAVRALARESFVVNTEPREADLRRKAAAQPRAAPTARARQRVELWHGIGVLLLGLLLCEALLTRRG